MCVKSRQNRAQPQTVDGAQHGPQARVAQTESGLWYFGQLRVDDDGMATRIMTNAQHADFRRWLRRTADEFVQPGIITKHLILH